MDQDKNETTEAKPKPDEGKRQERDGGERVQHRRHGFQEIGTKPGGDRRDGKNASQGHARGETNRQHPQRCEDTFGQNPAGHTLSPGAERIGQGWNE